MKARAVFYATVVVSSLAVLLTEACTVAPRTSSSDEDDEGQGGGGQGGSGQGGSGKGGSGQGGSGQGGAGTGGGLGGGASSASGGGSSAGGASGTGGAGGSPICDLDCSGDYRNVIDCNGNVVEACASDEACDSSQDVCANACVAAVNNKLSLGCEYYATFMDQFNPDACFAVFVANTWTTPAHITVDYNGASLPVASFARTPFGSGPSLTYQPFDPAAGIAPGQVAVLFLSGPQGNPGAGSAPCPVTSAVPSGVLMKGMTGVGKSFRVASDVPVVAYEISPYGGGSAAVTGASLLLPTSAWDTNYVAVNAAAYEVAPPSMNIVAMSDNTTVKMVPVAPVVGGGGVPASPANTLMTFTLNRGQHAQITQNAELTGSVIQSDKPVGFMAGHQCMRVPFGVSYCDHGEQMVPPIKALGSEYVGVQHRPRTTEPGIWRVIGTIDNTLLTWSEDVGGPATLNAGEAVQFTTSKPFVVKSQDRDHPFMLFAYMSGSEWQPDLDGYGDADFVISVPPDQYASQYVFFADPTYPETNLVVVRLKGVNGFEDVELDCMGTIGGWQPLGDYEWTRVDLITGNFQGVGGCSTGRREMKSAGRFGLWVWGWGTPLTTSFTQNVSYGYPGGMNVQFINTVVIPPLPN